MTTAFNAAESPQADRSDVHLAARVPVPLAAAVRQIATANDRSVSATVRLALADLVQREGAAT